MPQQRHIALICALLAGCHTAAPKHPTMIPVVYHPPNTCRIILIDREFSVWPDYKESLPALKAAAVKSPYVGFVGSADIPYKCLGAAIVAAQQAGLKPVGFISEPPRASH